MDQAVEQPRPMTAAEYAAHAEQAKAKRPTEIVTLKSGSIFELRRPQLQGYVMTGRLPQSLLLAGIRVKDSDKNVTEQDAKDFPAFAASLLRECCVNPKPDEIDMLPEDAWEIYMWAMTHQGVAGADGLRNFRSERQSTSVDSSDSKERGRESVAAVADER
jgi:hypothetical protein